MFLLLCSVIFNIAYCMYQTRQIHGLRYIQIVFSCYSRLRLQRAMIMVVCHMYPLYSVIDITHYMIFLAAWKVHMVHSGCSQLELQHSQKPPVIAMVAFGYKSQGLQLIRLAITGLRLTKPQQSIL
jgi:hypothetical protein